MSTTTHKVTVRLASDPNSSVVIPLSADQTVKDLIQQASKRLSFSTSKEITVDRLKTEANAVLFPDDVVSTVIDSNGVLIALQKSDAASVVASDPSTTNTSTPVTNTEFSVSNVSNVSNFRNILSSTRPPPPRGTPFNFPPPPGASSSIPKGVKPKGFSPKDETKTSYTPEGIPTTETKTYILIENENLRDVLRDILTDEEDVYEQKPKLDAELMLTLLPVIRDYLSKHPKLDEELQKEKEADKEKAKQLAEAEAKGKEKVEESKPAETTEDEEGTSASTEQFPVSEMIKSLLQFIEKKYASTEKKVRTMLAENKISYSLLWYIFHKGTKIYGMKDGDLLIGGEVSRIHYVKSGVFKRFEVTIQVIKSNGIGFMQTQTSFNIFKYTGLRKIEELPIHVMTKDVEEKLTARGKIFQKFSLSGHYKTYEGNMRYRYWWGVEKFKAHGRVMADTSNFNRMNPNYNEFRSTHYYARGQNGGDGDDILSMKEEQFYMAWPVIGGFSFTQKRWGEVEVEKLGEIDFDDKAYERLVLPADQKELIRALVVNSNKKTFADVISGKGAGCIFLLHGKPGVGKTLTAEAIAELLRRPLYSISVGELGTQMSVLETKLKEILEVASSWNAVILIDEADIFLEKRTESDIERNAMVGVFLRLLEYHQGVLFLTTNRVKSFDHAFHSRISVALHYKNLEEEAREKVWKNLLEAAEVKGLDTKKLAKYDVNGRQIRTMIRLAQSLAIESGVEVTEAHFDKTLGIARQFEMDLKDQSV